MTSRHVAIVGGGYTGAMLAVHLLRYSGVRVTLVERREEVARGAAYSTTSDAHLLNVRAARMSAFPDAPGHFTDWLGARGGDGLSFAQRQVYGQYLQEIFAAAAAAAGGRLSVACEEVVSIAEATGGERILLSSGAEIEADHVVLALGNMPPARNSALESLSPDTFVADPWSSALADGLDDRDTVLLMGTGLTAVDAALLLEGRGFGGRIVAMSRRGLLPRAHDRTGEHPPGLPEQPRGEPSALLKQVRRNAAQVGWRAAVDQLRPHTQKMWADASAAQRKRFLTHLRPYWDVHRHRIAPEVADRIEQMRKVGRLEIVAGRIVAAEAAGAGASVHWIPRRARGGSSIDARRIVNCTGPQLDITRSDEPLLRQLIRDGRIRPDVCRIGIDVAEDLQVLNAEGAPSPSLSAVGPITRGALWEIVAVPDLRVQTKMLADRLAS